MADIIDIDVFQTVTSVSFEVEPNTNIININKVTVEGTGGGGEATNLFPTQTATNFTINSDTGTDATIPLGNGILAGATLNDYTTAEKNKLAGIEAGANLGVPYTGATNDVNLGEFGIQLGNLEFDNTPTNIPTTAGSMYYNDSDGTLDLILKGGNVKLQIGQEQVVRVVNKTSTNIDLLEANYQAVRLTGTQGQRMKVDLAQATTDVLSSETIGLVTETIANNAEGFVTTSGIVRGINTTGSLQSETWLDGDILYLSSTIAGQITKVKPTAPNHLIIIGYVVSAHITQGTIFVKVDNGYEISELHDVKITTAANNNILAYTSATDIWENKTVATALGYTPANDNNVVHLTGDETIAGNKTFTSTINATSDTDYAISAISTNSDGLSAETTNGNGVVGISINGIGGVFMTTNNANIAEFKTNLVTKAAIQNNGKITATAGTASTDVVVKSQLDAKANDSSVVHLTGNETIAGLKNFTSDLTATKYLYSGGSIFPEFGQTFYINGTGATHYFGGGTSNVQNNLQVPNGTLRISLQTSNTIASFDANKNVVSLPLATYPDLTELSYVKGLTSAIQTQLNGKQPLATVLTNTTASFTTADETKLDGIATGATANSSDATLLARANHTGTQTSSTISDFNSATRAETEAELVAGTNITITPSGTGATRQLTIAASGGGASTQSAFTVLANNTNATATPTEQPFESIAQQTYTGTIVQTASSAASGTTNHSYQWTQVGKLVSLRINIDFANVGTSVSVISCELPSDCPAPALPTGVSASGDVLVYGIGTMGAQKSLVGGMGICALRIKSGTVYELVVTRTGASFNKAYYSIQYFTT